MIRISDESYERVNNILDDIGFACDTEDDYDQWEDIARPSFETFLDELDTDPFNMTCAAVKERIIDEYDSGKENYAKGIRAAFIGYLKDRRDYLDYTGEYDPPELPEDADENDQRYYNDEMEAYIEKKAYIDTIEKWIGNANDIIFE